jgi:hypothetical protein
MSKPDKKQLPTSKVESTFSDYHKERNKIALKQAEEQLKQSYTYEQMKAQTEMILGKNQVDE